MWDMLLPSTVDQGPGSFWTHLHRLAHSSADSWVSICFTAVHVFPLEETQHLQPELLEEFSLVTLSTDEVGLVFNTLLA
jgi:hypothetical protein